MKLLPGLSVHGSLTVFVFTIWMWEAYSADKAKPSDTTFASEIQPENYPHQANVGAFSSNRNVTSNGIYGILAKELLDIFGNFTKDKDQNNEMGETYNINSSKNVTLLPFPIEETETEDQTEGTEETTETEDQTEGTEGTTATEETKLLKKLKKQPILGLQKLIKPIYG